jgi:hypothetical protein
VPLGDRLNRIFGALFEHLSLFLKNSCFVHSRPHIQIRGNAALSKVFHGWLDSPLVRRRVFSAKKEAALARGLHWGRSNLDTRRWTGGCVPSGCG